MAVVELNEGGHRWAKQNLVTIVTSRTSFDKMKCVECGIEGKTVGLTRINLRDSYGDKISKCPKWVESNLPTMIEIIECHAVGAQFTNLKPGSFHKVIKPPSGYSNKPGRVWVMGVGEPVCVLSGEFKDLTKISDSLGKDLF
jgi:hypothetical protein